MGSRMRHRGRFQQTWSPAPGVYFGQASHTPFELDSAALFAVDWQAEGQAASLAGGVARTGIKAFAELRGFFTVAVRTGNDVLLAVDQVGYKELYYTWSRGRFAFASEYKALLALTDLPAEPARVPIQHYLATKQPCAGHSFLARVYAVPAGHAVTVTGGRQVLESYWRPQEQVVRRRPEEHVAVVREALLRTVERQIRPHDAIGLTIGGGLDAAAVLGAVRHVAPGLPVCTFTIGTSPDDHEILGARETAGVFGTEHHEFVFDPAMIPEELPKLVWLSEDCGGREEAMLQLQVLGEAGARVSTVMGGHGADVLFGGMPRHRLVGLAERLPWFSRPLSELFALSQAGTRPASLAGRALSAAVYGLHPPEIPAVPGVTSAPQVFWHPELNEFIRVTAQRMNSLNYLEPAHEAARATFHSPFLDPDMIEVSLTVPGWLKTGWRRQKWVLREAVADLLPESIGQRPKAIQRVHGQHTLGQVLGATAERWLCESSLERHGLLTATYLRRLRAEAGVARHSREVSHRLWTLLSLECWARQFLDLRGKPLSAIAAREMQLAAGSVV
jgi:asparagine synthase (glutamine-hydrolysing)